MHDDLKEEQMEFFPKLQKKETNYNCLTGSDKSNRNWSRWSEHYGLDRN